MAGSLEDYLRRKAIDDELSRTQSVQPSTPTSPSHKSEPELERETAFQETVRVLDYVDDEIGWEIEDDLNELVDIAGEGSVTKKIINQHYGAQQLTEGRQFYHGGMECTSRLGYICTLQSSEGSLYVDSTYTSPSSGTTADPIEEREHQDAYERWKELKKHSPIETLEDQLVLWFENTNRKINKYSGNETVTRPGGCLKFYRFKKHGGLFQPAVYQESRIQTSWSMYDQSYNIYEPDDLRELRNTMRNIIWELLTKDCPDYLVDWVDDLQRH